MVFTGIHAHHDDCHEPKAPALSQFSGGFLGEMDFKKSTKGEVGAKKQRGGQTKGDA